MAVQNMAWFWNWGNGNGSVSMQVNFAPTMAVAQCSLSQADGDGACAGGITQYRTPGPSGWPDWEHNFSISSETYWLPPVAYDPLMTSVSAELDLGEGQQGTMTLMVWLWS
jgi:hypothetical protein